MTSEPTLSQAWKLLADRLFPRISVDPEVMNGEPCIADTRIPVSMIVSLVADSEPHVFIRTRTDYAYAISVDEIRDALLFAARLTWHLNNPQP